MLKDGIVLGRLGVGKASRELAILYNYKRTAMVRATTDGIVGALNRAVFQQVMVSSGIRKIESKVKQKAIQNVQKYKLCRKSFLKFVHLQCDLPQSILNKLADILEQETFHAGQCIVKENDFGDTF